MCLMCFLLYLNCKLLSTYQKKVNDLTKLKLNRNTKHSQCCQLLLKCELKQGNSKRNFEFGFSPLQIDNTVPLCGIPQGRE